MNKRLLALLACPICKGTLTLTNQELICTNDALAFPIQESIPVLLESQARLLDKNSKDRL